MNKYDKHLLNINLENDIHNFENSNFDLADYLSCLWC